LAGTPTDKNPALDDDPKAIDETRAYQLTLQLQENLGVRQGRCAQEHPETWFPY
jgi:hypothetical protein